MDHQFASSDTRRIAYAALSGFYSVAPDYCTKAIKKVFATGTPEWITAIIAALQSKTWTGLPLLALVMGVHRHDKPLKFWLHNSRTITAKRRPNVTH